MAPVTRRTAGYPGGSGGWSERSAVTRALRRWPGPSCGDPAIA